MKKLLGFVVLIGLLASGGYYSYFQLQPYNEYETRVVIVAKHNDKEGFVKKFIGDLRKKMILLNRTQAVVLEEFIKAPYDVKDYKYALNIKNFNQSEAIISMITSGYVSEYFDVATAVKGTASSIAVVNLVRNSYFDKELFEVVVQSSLSRAKSTALVFGARNQVSPQALMLALEVPEEQDRALISIFQRRSNVEHYENQVKALIKKEFKNKLGG